MPVTLHFQGATDEAAQLIQGFMLLMGEASMPINVEGLPEGAREKFIEWQETFRNRNEKPDVVVNLDPLWLAVRNLRMNTWNFDPLLRSPNLDYKKVYSPAAWQTMANACQKLETSYLGASYLGAFVRSTPFHVGGQTVFGTLRVQASVNLRLM